MVKFQSRSLVSGLGQLNKPKYPEINGLKDFNGHLSDAQWDHNYNLEGKKEVVIGNGPSAIDFIPKIAEKVEQLTIFQSNN